MTPRALAPLGSLAVLLALAILLGLGGWQLQRRAEKAEQLAALERSITAEPLPLSAGALRRLRVGPAGSDDAASGKIGELRRVRVAGTFLPVPPIPVRVTLPAARDGRQPSGIGFFVMSPLALEGGGAVFVNRGFVTAGAGWKPPPLPAPSGPAEVVGLLRRPEAASPFGPRDTPEKGEFFLREPAALARAAGIAEALPFFIDEERHAGREGPAGADAAAMVARIPNNHLQYALTWFGLAATLLGVVAAFLWSRRRVTS
jgi:surfeit locus 1 family protein